VGSAAAAWPFAARAQQTPQPVIGFLGPTTPDHYAPRLGAFREGLKEAGYVEGRNVAIEYRWAEDDYGRLPALAAELVRQQVAVIVASNTPSAVAAKGATATIPIVFETSSDPVEAGLVSSLNRPGGNVTGVTNLSVEAGPKGLELVRELLPKATIIGVLVNPTSPTITEQFLRGLQATARGLGMQLHTVPASAVRDFDMVFATLAQLRADALVISPDTFFSSQSQELAGQALRQKLPAIYVNALFAAAGGLVSYGGSQIETYRLLGRQTGKVLSGAKPADLPVEQATKVELTINLKTAKALGIAVPSTLTGRADELIE